jgi:hypothetical protein
MPTSLLSINATLDDLTYSKSYADVGEGAERHNITLPAGLAGSAAWGGSSAVITLAAGHGLTTANKVAISWSTSSRIGMTISAYDATTITVTNSTGVGDSVPTSSTASVVVGAEVDCPDVSFDGDNAAFLLCKSSAGTWCKVNFLDSGPASLKVVELTAINPGYYWSYLSGEARPITGNPVADAKGYNLSTTATVIQFGVRLAT